MCNTLRRSSDIRAAGMPSSQLARTSEAGLGVSRTLETAALVANGHVAWARSTAGAASMMVIMAASSAVMPSICGSGAGS